MGSVPVLARFMNQNYTGDNRCIPCTLTNVVIALVLSGIIAQFSLPISAGVFLVSLSLIYVRGYLVPGTPTFTKRYLPDRILTMFDKSREPDAAVGTIGTEYVDPEPLLLTLGVVRQCDDIDDLCLTDAFSSEWSEFTASFREDPGNTERAARLLGASIDDTVVDISGDYPRISVNRRTRHWPSVGALIADSAADAAITNRATHWETIPLEQRLGILKALRTFLALCPVCDEPIEMEETTMESCCRSWEIIAVSCTGCGERILEIDPQQVERVASSQ